VKSSVRKFYVRASGFILLSFLIFAAFSYNKNATAHGQATPTVDEMSQRRQKQMEAQEADAGTPQDVDALSAIPCVGGFAGTYPCNKVDLMAFLPLGDIGGGSGNDIWGWTDPLDGKEYALMGRSSGTSFVDISDPENPIYLGNLPTHSSNSLWRDIKVYNNHAFIVSEASGHGMQVFDLTELRSVVNPPITFNETAHYAGFSNSHNIAINEASGFAYAVGTNTCSGGLHMIDISNPLNPTSAGCYSGDAYTHDTQCVIYNGPDAEHQGKEVCFSSNEDTLTIVDVSNKNTPVMLSRTTYPGVSYTHQGWLTEDHVYFLLDDEGDEMSHGHNTRTYLWNLNNLDVPLLIGNYTATTPAIDHNLYVKGNYVYQSNYRAGLRILDISGIGGGTLEEKGFFDIYPANDDPNFNGSWSNYPYFDSGIVIVSGIEQGLFVLRPQLVPDFGLQATPSTVGVCVPDEAAYNIDVLQFDGFDDPVTLSASGNPDGTTVDFSVNLVVPPGVSLMTIGNTGGAEPGSYYIDISGMAPTSTHTTTVGLNVYTTNPGMVSLVAPPDGAGDVDLVPTLEWATAVQGDAYYIEIATDDGFVNIVYMATISATSHQIGVVLDPDAIYFWHVRAENPCGVGDFSPTFSFNTRTLPPILLVDDDNDSPDVLEYFSSALDSLGYDYDVFDVGGGTGNGPTFDEMGGYQIVIWFSGDKFGDSAGPDAADETNLAAYLDAGGKLFLSSQDYLFDFGLTPFGMNYLGIGSYSNDAGGATEKYGVSGDPIGDGLGPYPLAYPPGFTDYGDIVNPAGGATTAFRSSLGGGNSLDLDKDGGLWKTVFFGTSWVAVNYANPANGEELLQRIVDWFGILPRVSIELVKTVGTQAEVCAATDSIEVVPGTEVTYCYEVTNSGDLTFPLHDLSDSELGLLLDEHAYDLDSGASYSYMTTAVILTNTVNSATWTAYVDEQTSTEASDSATVMVVNPAIELEMTVGLDTDNCAAEASLRVPAGSAVVYCYMVTNNGDVTLALHDLMDSELGALLDDYNFELLPGASTYYTATAVINENTVNTATWTAFVNDMITAEASDSAAVTVGELSIELNTTVGTNSNACATTDNIEVLPGTEVTYCFQVTNNGELTLMVHDLLDSEIGVILNGHAFELVPGAAGYITATATIQTNAINNATWTAYFEAEGAMVEDSDSATVIVFDTEMIYLPIIRKQ
jgi:choice-of-anchor B domain-containing protein